MKKLNQSGVGTEIREFAKLAVPLAGAQVAQAAMGFASTLMMGHLGQESLAAGGLASTTFQFLLSVASGVVMAVNPLIAEAHGADRKSQVEQLTRQGLWLSSILSIPMMFFVGHLDGLLLQLGQAAPIVAMASQYLGQTIWGIFPALGFTVLRGLVATISQAQIVTITVVVGLLVNVVSGYVLGYGKFSFPRMELVGLGLSITFSYWVMFVLLLIYAIIHSDLEEYPFWRELHRLKPQLLLRLMSIGVSIAASTLLEHGLFTIVVYLMGILGSEVLAAHQAVYQTAYLIFMVPLGISYATAIRVGYHVGRQDLKAARKAGYVNVSVAAGFMAVMAIFLLTHPQSVIGLFLDIHKPENADVLKLAVPMLMIAALSQFLDGVQSAAAGGLYGLQDMRAAMLLSFLAFWGVGLTSGCVLGFYFGLGGVGLWVGQSIGVAVGAGLFLWRFQSLTSKSDFV
nr:MATE family efflux transporter [Chamaesiphon minutus]